MICATNGAGCGQNDTVTVPTAEDGKSVLLCNIELLVLVT